MRHHAEAWFTDTEEVAAHLGRFETATEARSACAVHADTVLSWQQTESGAWQARSDEYLYRVVGELPNP